MKHKRKLYYPIGLLSLSILLFVYIVDMLNDPRAYAKNVMDVYLISKNYRETFKHWQKDYDMDIDIPPDGNWNVFSFTSDEKKNTKVFDSLLIAVKQYLLTRDSIRGIEIRLGRKMSFNRFVLIMDMLELERVNLYNVIDSSIWVPRFPRYRKPVNNNTESFICGGVVYPPEPDVIELGRLDMVFVKWWFFCRDEIPKIPLPIMLAWLGLFSLNIVRLVKWRKVR